MNKSNKNTNKLVKKIVKKIEIEYDSKDIKLSKKNDGKPFSNSILINKNVNITVTFE